MRSMRSFLSLLTAMQILLSIGTTNANAAPAQGKTSSGSKAFVRASASSPIGDKWAVVIGISRFADPHVPELKYASKDARDFYDFLVDPSGGKFARDHVKLLLNESATSVNIRDMLGDSFLPHAANPDDLVVIYLSTHGSPAGADIRGVNYVLSYDTNSSRLFSTGLEMKQLMRVIKERVHSNRILLVLDTCYSGAGGEHKDLVRTNVDSQSIAQGIGSMVISSSAANQRSWESDNLKNSYFTRLLIDTLKKEPDASVERAFATMKDKVQESVLREKGEMQTPVLSGNFSGPKLVLSMAPRTVRPAPITLQIGEGEAPTEQGLKSSAVDLTSYGQKMKSARELIAQKKLWEASHELNAALKRNPTSVEAHLLLCDVYNAQARFKEALDAATRAVVNDAQSSEAREQLSLAYWNMKDPNTALRHAQQAVTLEPSSSMAQYLVGLINEQGFKRLDLAEQQYRKAMELNGLNAFALIALANLLDREGKDTEQFEPLIKQAISADEDNWQARLAMGRLLARKNSLEPAEKEIRKALAINPHSAVLNAELGNILSRLPGKTAEAEVEYKKALSLGPNEGLIHLMFADFLLDVLNRTDEAEKEYQTAIKLDPDLDRARVRYGNLLILKRHAYDEADAQFQKALVTNPKNADAHLGIAQVKFELLKDYAGAEAELKKAMAIDPKYSLPYDRLGILMQFGPKRYADAKKAFEQAIALDNRNAAAHYHLAMLLLERVEQSAPSAILNELEKAVAHGGSVSTYHTALGNVQQKYFKKAKEAETAYRKAIELDITDSEAHLRLGLLLITKFNQRKAGERELTTAHEQNPNNAEIKAAYERYVH